MTSILKEFEKTVERWSKRSIEEIRRETFLETRKKVERKRGYLKLFSEFPFIGRGNVQRDNIISHEDVEKELDDALQ